MNRRTFLGYLAAAFSAFVAAVVGLPSLAFMAAPLARKETANWLSLGKVSNFKAGEPKLVAVSISKQDGWRRITEARTCWVLASDDGEFAIFNGRCTHLGCAYSWRTEGQYAESFFCPCHDGVYGKDGSVVDGPPPRPLDRMQAHVDEDELFVLYQDFRLGVEAKESA